MANRCGFVVECARDLATPTVGDTGMGVIKPVKPSRFVACIVHSTAVQVAVAETPNLGDVCTIERCPDRDGRPLQTCPWVTKVPQLGVLVLK